VASTALARVVHKPKGPPDGFFRQYEGFQREPTFGLKVFAGYPVWMPLPPSPVLRNSVRSSPGGSHSLGPSARFHVPATPEDSEDLRIAIVLVWMPRRLLRMPAL